MSVGMKKMKRSEMVNLLADFLAANYDEEWINQKDHVSSILSFIEINGMLPPIDPIYNFYKNFCNWEPEDITLNLSEEKIDKIIEKVKKEDPWVLE